MVPRSIMLELLDAGRGIIYDPAEQYAIRATAESLLECAGRERKSFQLA